MKFSSSSIINTLIFIFPPQKHSYTL